MYADALIHHEEPEHTSHDKEEVVVHRRMSLPESKGQDEGEDKRSSTGDYCVPITIPRYPGVQSVDRGMFIEHLQVARSLFGTEHVQQYSLTMLLTIIIIAQV